LHRVVSDWLIDDTYDMSRDGCLSRKRAIDADLTDHVFHLIVTVLLAPTHMGPKVSNTLLWSGGGELIEGVLTMEIPVHAN
jgi:hypothetical protein